MKKNILLSEPRKLGVRLTGCKKSAHFFGVFVFFVVCLFSCSSLAADDFEQNLKDYRFEKYKNFPEFNLKFYDFELIEFKKIFFWEYFHRIWGRLIGGRGGFTLGGPFGMLLGSLIGGKISRSRTSRGFSSAAQGQQMFALSLIVLSAKLSKADGQVSKEELIAVKDKLINPDNEIDP